MSSYIAIESTGVYKGIVQEDMIETVKATKRQYCKVLVPEFWDDDSDYPYTYVPDWAMVLPLKKDDEVYVKFSQDNMLYPFLYKNNNELPSGCYDKQALMDSGTLVTMPAAMDTVTVREFGTNSYIITTEDYTVFRYSDTQAVLFSDDGTFVTGSNVNVLTGSSGAFTLESPQIKLGKDSSSTLGTFLGQLIDAVVQLKTYGSPANHAVTPDSQLTLNNLKQQLQGVFL